MEIRRFLPPRRAATTVARRLRAGRVAGAAPLLCLTAALAASFALPALAAVGTVLAERFSGGVPPRPFYRELGGVILGGHGGVVAVAHNAGDRLAATRQALGFGAEVVEVDVVSMGDRLFAGHVPPLPLLGPVTFQGPALEAVWEAAAEADAIMLDLKESSPAFLELVFAFLDERPAAPRVMLVNGNPSILRAFRDRAPRVARILGVSPPGRLAALRDDAALQALIDGVVLRHDRLDAASAAWLEERGVFTMVWTVNDLAAVNRLIGLGVDAIVTDNLALMEALGSGPTAPLAALPSMRPPPFGAGRRAGTRGLTPRTARRWPMA